MTEPRAPAAARLCRRASSRWPRRATPTNAALGRPASGAGSCRWTGSTSRGRLAPQHPAHAIIEIRIEPRLRRRRRRLRRPARDLDQRADPAALLRRCTRIGHAHSRRGLAGRALWSAGSTAWRSAAAFFGESMFSRRTRRLEGRAGLAGGPAAARRLPAVRHPVPDPASGLARRGRDPARAVPSPAGARRWHGAATFDRPPTCPTPQAVVAAQHPDIVARMVERAQRRAERDHPAVEQHRAGITVSRMVRWAKAFEAGSATG